LHDDSDGNTLASVFSPRGLT